MIRAPSYVGLHPSSLRASIAGRGSSKKYNTKPEILLRGALWQRGLYCSKNRSDLPGVPDIVFENLRLVVFVDGDFWHGKNWRKRKAKLRRGHNADYWISKIERNMSRDVDCNRKLRSAGWAVLRVWESDIHDIKDAVLDRIETALMERRIVISRAQKGRPKTVHLKATRHRH